jgi:ribosomal protein S6
MWMVTINCSAESWGASSTTFKAIAEKYGGKILSSKKMKDDERRIMEYQIEDVGEAEAFVGECVALSGFTAFFESL